MSFIYGQKIQGGGEKGQDRAKNIGTLLKGFVMLVSSFGAPQAICKRRTMGTMLKGLNDFERQQIFKFFQFCHIWQNVPI